MKIAVQQGHNLPPKHQTVLSRQKIMGIVLIALVPGTLMLCYFFGYGVIRNLLISVGVALLTEALALTLRGQNFRQIATHVADGTAVVTGALLALSLPPGISLYVLAVATIIAIGVAKHIFGGMGNNVFNPAMAGYATVLVSFPAQLALWPPTSSSLSIDAINLDAITGATILDQFKYRGASTVADFVSSHPNFGSYSLTANEWIALAFALAGLVLLVIRIINWRVVAATLLSFSLMAAVFYDAGSSASLGSPVFHWASGGTMLALFFVVTDPVTHPANAKGQWIYGITIGFIAFTIRCFGNYPDGWAFAILFGNAITPFLDMQAGK